MAATIRDSYRSALAQLATADRDLHRTLVRDWADVLDRYDWTDDQEADFETALYDLIDLAREGR